MAAACEREGRGEGFRARGARFIGGELTAVVGAEEGVEHAVEEAAERDDEQPMRTSHITHRRAGQPGMVGLNPKPL